MDEGVMSDGLVIAMSPVQLAAVLSDKTITEGETLGNRMWGSLEFALGALEMVGAAVLCVAPEPTGLTKVGCVVVGAHSMDAVNTAANKVITGMNTRTATHRTAEALAKKFGADEDTAFRIGLTVDIAVPLGFAAALGAIRVASIRSGRISLLKHESSTGMKPGGHTIDKHVAKSPEELIKRFASSPNMKVSTSFTNLRLAEESISDALRYNTEWITVWAASSTRPTSPFVINHSVGRVIGYGVRRGEQAVTKLTKFRIVIRFETFHGKPYYILTAYPTF
jgi:Bacterial CdiA-CT RNAse A domain